MFARVKVPTEILPRFVTLKQPAGRAAAAGAARGRDRPPPRRAVPGHGDRRLRRLPRHPRRRPRGLRRRRRPAAGGRGRAAPPALRRGRARRGRRAAAPSSCARRSRACSACEEDEVYPVDGLLDMGALWQIVRLPGHAELREEPIVGITHPRLLRHEGERPDVLGAMREGDLLVHHPYVSFATSVERFVEQAVADPNVLAIKQTVYRTSDDSPLVPALIDATERGKQAVALVELQARFDERMNIQWAKALEEAGVHVVYGQPGAEDPRQVRARRAPRGRRRAQLRAHRHRQLPLRDRPPVHRLRPVHHRRGDRRRRGRHVQLPHRLRPPAGLPQGAGGARPPARRDHRPDRADDRGALGRVVRRGSR